MILLHCHSLYLSYSLTPILTYLMNRLKTECLRPLRLLCDSGEISFAPRRGNSHSENIDKGPFLNGIIMLQKTEYALYCRYRLSVKCTAKFHIVCF